MLRSIGEGGGGGGEGDWEGQVVEGIVEILETGLAQRYPMIY